MRQLTAPEIIGFMVMTTSGACGTETRLELTFLRPEQCEAFCIDEIELRADNLSPLVVPCGQPTSILLDDVSEVRVRALGAGYPLSGTLQIDGEAGDRANVDLVLTSSDGPQITDVLADRADLWGPTPVVITGRFGPPQGDWGVSIAGADVDVIQWSERRIVVQSERAGEVTVRACGVASSTVALNAGEATYRTFRPQLACPQSRLAALTSLPQAERITALFSCNGGACSGAMLAQLDPADGRVIQSFEQIPLCPYDVALTDDPDRGYLAFGERLWAFDIADGRLNALSDRAFRFNKISVVSGSFAVLSGRRLKPWTWSTPSESPVPAFRDDFDSAADVDGPYVAGTGVDGRFLIARVQGDSIAAQSEVSCAPRALARTSSLLGTSPRVIVACDRAVEVFAGDSFSRRIDLPANLGRVVSAALSIDGHLAMLLTDANVLIYVGLDEGWATSRPLPPTAPDVVARTFAVIARAPSADRFFITAPRWDEVVQVELRPKEQ